MAALIVDGAVNRAYRHAMTPTLWSLLGGSLAIFGEYLYRTLPGGAWHHNLHVWLPLSAAVSLCVYHIVRAPGTSLLGAFVIWTSTTIFLRILVTVVLLRDPVTRGTWAAVVLLVIARLVQQVWK